MRPEWYVQTVARGMIALANLLAFVLLGTRLYPVLDGRGGMFELTPALGLVALGIGTSLSTSERRAFRRAARVALSLVALCALAILLASFELGSHRIPANTALLFTCLCPGIAGGDHRSLRVRWFADGLVISGAGVALFALIALLFGSRVQYPLAGQESMTITTAAIGFLLAVAVIVQRTDRGIGELFNSHGSGGVLARRLVPMLLILPVGIARLTYLGVENGTYDAAFAMSIGVTIGVAILTIVIVASARVVDRLDTVRRGNEAQIRQMVGDIARQSTELKRSNQELESFSYSVSHDLRAPIRHIAGFSELLVQVSGRQLDDKAKHYLAMIAESAGHAGKLIDDLLEFSRMGRTQMKMNEVALDAVVRDAWMRLAPERTGRSIELRVAPLPAVKADPAMLEVVIGNLLSNAVKYSGRRAEAVIDVEAHNEGDATVISIRDNGAGFDMRYVDKLFAVFQRLHGDEFEGVGIGLANVKRIIERHGGRVWAEGEVDRGASFHFTLPRAAKD